MIVVEQDDRGYFYNTQKGSEVGPFSSSKKAMNFAKKFYGADVDIVLARKPRVYEEDGHWFWTDGHLRGPFLGRDMAVDDLKMVLQNEFDEIIG